MEEALKALTDNTCNGKKPLIAGVVAEYNPFHNGHKYLLDFARQAGADGIVVAMSGNFVQRGEPALFDKNLRSAAAVDSGADLVLEIPVPYSVAGAQRFARAGVKTLLSLGCVDEIYFGSECGNTQLIEKTADLLQEPGVNEKIKEFAGTGVTFAAAREAAVRCFSPECADILRNPNDILAIEYVCAIKAENPSVKAVAVKRCGASHDSASFSDEKHMSASAIRSLILSCNRIPDSVNKEAEKVFASCVETGQITDYAKFETAVFCKLLTASKNEILRCPEVSEGIENRFLSSAEKAGTLGEFYDLVKTKRYTHARIRRIATALLLGVTEEIQSRPVPYISVLKFNENGQKILRLSKDTVTLPVISKPALIKKQGRFANECFELNTRADRLFAAFQKEGSL